MWLREQPIRVLGPNCLGWIRPSRRLNATFAPGMPPAGGIAFLSHSGALATAILDWARARRLGFLFFATLGNKISSPDISHKTDVGGISLGVSSPAEVARIAAAMLARVRQQRPDATIQGVMVQPMAPPGKELLLGALHDAQFGPLVLVGFGGTYVEVLRDTTDDCAAGHHGARSLGGQLRHRGPRVTTSVLPHRRPIVIQGLLKLEKRL
jgi:acyl-CoA synthetase (NDP forming)